MRFLEVDQSENRKARTEAIIKGTVLYERGVVDIGICLWIAEVKLGRSRMINHRSIVRLVGIPRWDQHERRNLSKQFLSFGGFGEERKGHGYTNVLTIFLMQSLQMVGPFAI